MCCRIDKIFHTIQSSNFLALAPAVPRVAGAIGRAIDEETLKNNDDRDCYGPQDSRLQALGLYRLAWDPDCWFDVSAFESLLDGKDGERQSRLEQAIALYQGDLLDDYDARWLLPIRERLRLRFMDALLELGELYAEQGKFASARAVLQRAVELDGFYEPAIQALMRLYALDQQPSLALDAYLQFGQRLQ